MSKRKHQINAYFQQGDQLHRMGRLAEAERVYREILSVMPNHAESLHRLGVIALQTGHHADALTLLDRAIAAAPREAGAHANRAAALLGLGRASDAVAAAQAALRHKRNSAEAHHVLGHALLELGRVDDAIGAYRQALQHDPRLPEIRNDLGLALADASRLAEAADVLGAALRATPGDDMVRVNLASVLKEAGRLPDAEAMYRDLLTRHPRDPRLHFNLGVLLLLAGRFEEGWTEWEWRFQAEPGLCPTYPQPLWSGGPLHGRTLLVHAEQGLGDMIQFCRYLPLLPRNGTVIVRVQPPLVSLLREFGTVVADSDPIPSADLRVPMMSLPLELGLTHAADIPATVPYLRGDPAATAGWQARLADRPGLRVGLAWAGNPGRARMDRRRSVAVERLAPLATIPGVHFVSLQKGTAAPDWMEDWTGALTDFADTAALIQALDLVISVDTAVAHLAGALGKPVWLLNRADTCWRWQLGRDDSPWYPTLRQFRQATPGVWDDPIAAMTDALRTLAATAAAATGT